MAQDKRLAAFSDLDGTILYYRDHSQNLPNKGFALQSKDDGPHGRKIFWSSLALELLDAIQKHYFFNLVTGRHRKSFENAQPVLEGHYAKVALENGCVVFEDGRLKQVPHQVWYNNLKRWIGEYHIEPNGTTSPYHPSDFALWRLADYVARKGRIVERDGRFATVRLRLGAYRDDFQNNKFDSVDNLEEACKQYLKDAETELGITGITIERHEGFIDFMPEAGGKTNLLRAFCAETHTDISHTVGLGNDYNDLGFLGIVGYPITLASAEPCVQELVKGRRGFVSPYKHHLGTIDMLAHLLTHHLPKTKEVVVLDDATKTLLSTAYQALESFRNTEHYAHKV